VRNGFRPISSPALTIGLLCMVCLDVTTRAHERRCVDVLVTDQMHVPLEVLEAAKDTAARIFRKADVEVSWFTRDTVWSRPGPIASPYTIRVVERATQWQPKSPSVDALGFAVIGSRVASVLYPRIEQLAGGSIRDTSIALGYVIAHELGHLLLRNGAHSLVGLMQSDFNLLLAQQGRLWFTDDEARHIRTLLATENP
jgi:hypothetical protein